jgi:hypothetical protein
MDPATFQLIMMGLSIGSQALQTFITSRQQMTPEQVLLLQPFLDRITTAQLMVTPYQKEPGN